jgi:uncharacterized membrane protein
VTKGRLEAFSDGVFAVAITLLALNLAIAGPGHGDLVSQLTRHLPADIAYLISFFTIGVIWVNHHALFDQLAQIDRVILFLNLLLLLFVVAIPFATATMAAYLEEGDFDARLAAAIYGWVMIGMSVGFSLILARGLGHGGFPLVTGARARMLIQLRFSIGTLVYLVASVLAFVNPWIALVCYGLTALYYVLRQTPVTRAADVTTTEQPEGRAP